MNSIGLVGSPSTTRTITMDILEDASTAGLQGELVYLTHELDESWLVALGTVTEIETSNRWHEDPNMRGVLKRHGRLPHLSGIGDVRTGEVEVQAVYRAVEQNPALGDPPIEAGGALSMSPTTGAPICRVTNTFLENLLRRHADELAYLGHIYRSDVRLPVRLKHFGKEADGGAGEAYHTGIFGMTGSGKSGLATYLVALQLLHEEMGVLIMDPQGQFTTEEGLPFSLQNWAKERGRRVEAYDISNDLRLPKNAPLLSDLLGLTRFFRALLQIKTKDNRDTAVIEFTNKLRDTDHWEDQDAADVLRGVLQDLRQDNQALTRIYALGQAHDRLTAALDNMLSSSDAFKEALELFSPIHSFFTSKNLEGGDRQSLFRVLLGLLESKEGERPLTIIDLSGRSALGSAEAKRLLDSTPVKARILREICKFLVVNAERAYKKGESLNASIIFDEAQRFAPQASEHEEAEMLAQDLVENVRTTRKYGLGWTFITQEVGSLRRGIFSQTRVRCFGYGLTAGSELRHLRDAVGDRKALELYRSFVDPGAISPAEFPFMITGPVSPLSFTGAPLFLSVFTDFDEFSRVNGFA